MARRYREGQLAFARLQRRSMTRAEAILWRVLRDRGAEVKFRRQVPIGPYVGDFVCIAAKLVVELDGEPHDDPAQRDHDRRRDAWLRRQGWQVMRFPNDQVIGGADIVVAAIREEAARLVMGRSGQD